jgi:hypothetical protein
MTTNKIIFVDYTAEFTHLSVKNKAIGASEYQFYNLIEKISNDKHIYCYNCIKNIIEIDNITYDHFDNFVNNILSNDDIIIFQRYLPNQLILDKIQNNKIYLWIHDIASSILFLNDDKKLKFYANKSIKFKKDYLNNIQANKNYNFIHNSLFCKKIFENYLLKHDIVIEENRFHLIYNILYEDELKIKNENKQVNINNIVYASAWQKGIEKVISIFDFIFTKDNSITLTLMSPGYDYHKYENYKQLLKNKYKDNILILGPLNKQEYAQVIRSACCVISSTFQETFGCVFAESYYLGTPVIADINSGAVIEIIEKENIVNYNNYDEVYNKFTTVKNNRDKCIIKLDEKFFLDYNLKLWKQLLNI